MNVKSFTSCKHASRLISEQLDHPLTLMQWIALQIHLAMCTNCVFFKRQVTALKQLLGMYAPPEDDLPSPYTVTLSSETKQRIKLQMREGNA